MPGRAGEKRFASAQYNGFTVRNRAGLALGRTRAAKDYCVTNQMAGRFKSADLKPSARYFMTQLG